MSVAACPTVKVVGFTGRTALPAVHAQDGSVDPAVPVGVPAGPRMPAAGPAMKSGGGADDFVFAEAGGDGGPVGRGLTRIA
jgi:hypothetical protein